MSAELGVRELEAKVLDAAAGGWLQAIDRLRVLLADKDPLIAEQVLRLVAPNIEATALSGVADAFGLGIDDALRIAQDGGLDIVGAGKKAGKGRPLKAPLAIIRDLDKLGARALVKAQKLARAGIDPEIYLAPLFKHATMTRGQISDAMNLASNIGSTRVADTLKRPTVWVAEFNACVECLAYSGIIAQPGETFPGGLTYGRKVRNPGAQKYPPKHRHCRCQVELLNDKSYADALRREADRSVIRGFSLESESMSVRVDAAKRLIDRGVDAPKSVIAYGKKAVEAGRFPNRGRAA